MPVRGAADAADPRDVDAAVAQPLDVEGAEIVGADAADQRRGAPSFAAWSAKIAGAPLG